MSTTIRIELDAKKRLERIAEIEGFSLKQTIQTAITIYEIEVMRRFTDGERLDAKSLKKLVELREWMRRTGKTEFKELVKKK